MPRRKRKRFAVLWYGLTDIAMDVWSHDLDGNPMTTKGEAEAEIRRRSGSWQGRFEIVEV